VFLRAVHCPPRIFLKETRAVTACLYQPRQSLNDSCDGFLHLLEL
jgi:hypothetical protein